MRDIGTRYLRSAGRARQRGAGLATVLLIMAVLATIALTLAGSTTFHLRLANRQSQTEQARNLAESVLCKAKDRLLDERDFGAPATESSDVVTLQLTPDSPVGRLTFHAPLAEDWGVPVSVNNLQGDSSVVLADGHTLPPFSVYLAARAEYGGVPCVMETVVTIPLYKYALATSGTIVSNGRLLVASIDDDTDLSGGLLAIPPEDLKPGHLAALGTDTTVLDSPSPANGSLVTGDVVSGGSVTLGAFTDVRGSVKQNHEPETLPDLTVTDYDPTGWVGLETINQAAITNEDNPLNPLTLEGVWRRQGNLQVLGGLDLDGGYLYVDGDLHINGGVSGKGSLFCTGDITVGAASGFATDNVQALVAGGDISISGGNQPSDRNNSFFTGILFGRGQISLSNVTVVGSVVNNSPDETTLELNNVALLSSPDVLTFDLGLPAGARSGTLSGTNSDYAYNIIPSAPDFAQYFSPEDDEFSSPLVQDIPLTVYLTADVGTVFDDPVLFGQFESYADLQQGFVDGGVWDGGNPTDMQMLEQQVDDYRINFLNALANLNDLYQSTRMDSLTRGKFSLEPNQFVPFEDRVRVVWSREVPAL